MSKLEATGEGIAAIRAGDPRSGYQIRGNEMGRQRNAWARITPHLPSCHNAFPTAWPTRSGLFFACCAIILGVSVHDAVLIIVNHETIVELEQNPIGLWLLHLQNGSVWLFVVLKLLGTSLAGAVLMTLHQIRQQLALACGLVVAALQLGLLCYLTLA